MDPDVRRESAEQRPGNGYSPVLKNLAIKKEEGRGQQGSEDKGYGGQRAMFIMEHPISYARHRYQNRKSRWMWTMIGKVVIMQSASKKNIIPFPERSGDRNKTRDATEDQQSH